MIRMIRLHTTEDVVDFINEHQIRKEDIVTILSGSSGCVLIWEEVDSDASDD